MAQRNLDAATGHVVFHGIVREDQQELAAAVAGHEVACAIAEHHGHAVRTCEHLRILERLLDEFRELHEADVGLREQRIG